MERQGAHGRAAPRAARARGREVGRFLPAQIESAPAPAPARAAVELAQPGDDGVDDDGEDSDAPVLTALFVRVLDGATQRPCADATVSVQRDSTDCDAQGLAELRYLGEAPPPLNACAPGYVARSVNPDHGHDSRANPFVIELERGGTLVARIEPVPKSGFPGLRVTVAPERSDSGGGSESFFQGGVSRRTLHGELAFGFFDATGTVTLDGLKPGLPLELSVTDRRVTLLESPETIVLASGERREVHLRLDETCELSGLAHDARGAPIADLGIWLLPAGDPPQRLLQETQNTSVVATTRSLEDGSFRFSDVRTGTWLVGPEPQRRPAASNIATRAVVVEVSAHTREQRVDLEVVPGLFLAGVVLDARGDPASGVFVKAHEGDCGAVALTRAEGRFEIGPLPAGSYEVVACRPGSLEPGDTLRAQAGERELVLRMRPACSLSGRVVDASTGSGLAAQLTLLRRDEPETAGVNLYTELDGSFEFEGLREGGYAILATDYERRVSLVSALELAPGRDLRELVIRLEEGARIVAHYSGEHSVELRLEQSGVRLGRPGMQPGAAQTLSVPAGTLVLVLRTADGREERHELALAAGEERALELREPK
ncbi:MAG: carboxypeptidase regulatory-like domain-containing protein [Planctomycetes bacterium]|nr:carboxypeptidase regulatory-like domain-containing protein [Planctomycetota bacterium]